MARTDVGAAVVQNCPNGARPVNQMPASSPVGFTGLPPLRGSMSSRLHERAGEPAGAQLGRKPHPPPGPPVFVADPHTRRPNRCPTRRTSRAPRVGAARGARHSSSSLQKRRSSHTVGATGTGSPTLRSEDLGPKTRPCARSPRPRHLRGPCREAAALLPPVLQAPFRSHPQRRPGHP